MKTSIIPLLAISFVFSGCTTYRVKKDDHSYTYIYQHNENPESIQMNNKIKKPNNDVFGIPYKSNTKSTYQAPFYDSPAVENIEQFSADSNFRKESAPRTYTPEMNDYVSRQFDGSRRNNVHNSSPYPYYIPNSRF